MTRKIKVNRFPRQREHVEVAERVLGRKLAPPVVVHHADRNRFNNDPGNLVVCPNPTYHKLLHARMRALEGCGNANWRKCWICKKYDSVDKLVHHGFSWLHRQCRNAYQQRRRAG